MTIRRLLIIFSVLLGIAFGCGAQVNTEQVLRIGQNALYFEDYMLSIQYFNQAIAAKPYLAQPYFLRSVAKVNLEDYVGAEADATKAIELNPYLTDAYEVRGVARQNRGKLHGAIEDYEKALELLPRNRQLLFNKALAQTDADDYEGARRSFAELLRFYPKFSNGYVGRARMSLEAKDTVQATADINKALELDSRSANAYIMRADIAINSHADYEKALDDIDHAIKLMPNSAGLYINRAFLRYNLDSYNGAMADYDYALTLDPLNKTALFNRALLLAEVSANDLALEDFNRVLDLDPNDYRALYNRAVIHKAKGNYEEAIEDINKVAERFPDFPDAIYFRGSVYQEMGRLVQAENDYKKGKRMAQALRPQDATTEDEQTQQTQQTADDDIPQELAAKRFQSLLTVDDNAEIHREYNNAAIQGRAQDRSVGIEIEPMMLLSFYTSPTELRPATIYIREVEDLNATRMLRFLLNVTNVVPTIDERTAGKHFQSIDYYNSYLSTHQGRPIDYIGRALDFITVRDYINAERDADRAAELAPDLALAYLIRAQARYGRYLLERDGIGSDNSDSQSHDATLRAAQGRAALDAVREDLDKVIELSPDMAVAWFNKGNILFAMGEPAGAISAYSEAIRIKSDFGEAYFNRGYMKLQQGMQADGVADLSKAGELGMIPAYNLIKRLSR